MPLRPVSPAFPSRGLFIAFEGIDGCGKSTAAGTLAERIRAGGHACILTEEPTDGPVGKDIRLILTDEAPAMEPFELQRLFVEDRRDHIEGLSSPRSAKEPRWSRTATGSPRSPTACSTSRWHV